MLHPYVVAQPIVFFSATTLLLRAGKVFLIILSFSLQRMLCVLCVLCMLCVYATYAPHTGISQSAVLRSISILDSHFSVVNLDLDIILRSKHL